MRLARLERVRILEARFLQPQRDGSPYMVVAHVVWRRNGARERPVVRAAPGVDANGTASTVLAKLQYLLTVTAPDSFTRLQALRSRFWAFVDVGLTAHDAAAADPAARPLP